MLSLIFAPAILIPERDNVDGHRDQPEPCLASVWPPMLSATLPFLEVSLPLCLLAVSPFAFPPPTLTARFVGFFTVLSSADFVAVGGP